MSTIAIIVIIVAMVSVFGYFMYQNLQTVSKSVKESFKSRHPNAKNVFSETNEQQQVRYTFSEGGKEYEEIYNEDGTCIQEAERVTYDDLPEAIQKKITTKFNNIPIESILKVNRKGQATRYKFDLKSDKAYMEVVFTEKGKMLDKKVTGSVNVTA